MRWLGADRGGGEIRSPETGSGTKSASNDAASGQNDSARTVSSTLWLKRAPSAGGISITSCLTATARSGVLASAR